MMQEPDRIDAPAEVEEGTTTSITLTVEGTSSSVSVSNSRTGESFSIPVVGGKAVLEVPNSATAGDVLFIVDRQNPTTATSILITPASVSR